MKPIGERRKILAQAGFTLIEVMVAVAMLVIVIGAIYGVFHAANQSSTMVEEQSDIYQTARVLLDSMTKELSSIHTLSGSQTCSIQGESAADNGYPDGFDTLTFTTVSHEPCGDTKQRGDVCTVSYSARCTQDGTPEGFYVTEDYTLGLRTSDSSQDELPATKLSDMVIGMKCTYLDPDTEEWADDWLNKTKLPSAVRIELIIQPKRKSASPVSIVQTVSIPSWANSQSSSSNSGSSSGSSPSGGASDGR